MSAAQFGRMCSLRLGNSTAQLDLSSLQIKFQVHQGDIQTPNSADIRVYNVSAETAQRIQKEFSKVILQAGYEGNFGTIFSGTAVQLRRGRESSIDSYLDITAGDGDQAYNFALMNKSLSAGSTATDRLRAITGAMAPHGVDRATTAQLPDNRLARGKVMFGLARDHARALANNTQTDWSIQDGQLTLIPKSAYLPGEIPVITAATGMIGMPEQTQDGIKLTCLLNPNIKMGGRIQLDNASIQQFKFGLSLGSFAQNAFVPSLDNDGIYRVLRMEHAGDTRGQEWYTTIICIGARAQVPPSLLTRTTVS